MEERKQARERAAVGCCASFFFFLSCSRSVSLLCWWVRGRRPLCRRRQLNWFHYSFNQSPFFFASNSSNERRRKGMRLFSLLLIDGGGMEWDWWRSAAEDKLHNQPFRNLKSETLQWRKRAKHNSLLHFHFTKRLFIGWELMKMIL